MPGFVDNLLDGIGGVLDIADMPGSYTRGLLSGDPGSRSSGREMLEAWGVLGQNRSGLDTGDVLGLLAEILTDPIDLAAGLGASKLVRNAAESGRMFRSASDGYRTAYGLEDDSLEELMERAASSQDYDKGRLGYHLAAFLPKAHEKLNQPMWRSRVDSELMGMEDFAYGRPVADPLPMPNIHLGAGDSVNLRLGPASDSLSGSWSTLSARRPDLAQGVERFYTNPNLSYDLGQAEALRTDAGRTWIGLPESTEIDGPTLLHELVHAGQYLEPSFDPSMSEIQRVMALEPSATRAGVEAWAAETLHGHARNLNRRDLGLSALAGVAGRHGHQPSEYNPGAK